MIMNTKRNLKHHLQDIDAMKEKKIDAMGPKSRVDPVETRTKLFKTLIMLSAEFHFMLVQFMLACFIEYTAWDKILETHMAEVDRKQSNALKQSFQILIEAVT